MYDDERIEIEVSEADENVDLGISENYESVGLKAEDVVQVRNNQDKTVIPTTSQQMVMADSGYTGLGTVTVDPIPSCYGLITYNGSTITVS